MRILNKAVSRGCNSFVTGTEVLLADGTSKAIEEVQIGDKVVATDPETGETRTETVTAKIRTPDDSDFATIALSGEGASPGESLTATAHHLIWSPSVHGWIKAGDLVPGMTLRTDDGRSLRVEGVKHFRQVQVAYNLTITHLHSYYVLVGDVPVLVHNDDAELCRLLGISQIELNRHVGDAYRDHIADSFRQRGMTVVTDADSADMLTFDTPWGDRRYDIGILDSNGRVTDYVETKSGDVGKDELQKKKDAYLERRYGIKVQYVFDGHGQ
ncbi:polymorphic toxin-type HINT domain-containing protein [Streptomyces sp. NPDC058864]